ncbi:MAG: SDR family NAD(P)-dependent oxidoreductase [Eubacteriales bacterium]|nr:SDR family NAD(P)-dependent oxidoreductase [Eubacteriales bacterium]
MKNKVIFITGGTVNTGLAIAEHFASKGYDVAISSRELKRAEKAAEKIAADYGIKAVGYGLDLMDTDDIARVFGEIRSDFGALDVFVSNSADLGIDVELLQATPERFDEIFGTNVRGTYFCCKNAALLMKETGSGGAIVIIGSVHAYAAMRGRGIYAASKGALLSLTKSLAYELAEFDIRANYVAPGAIHTNRWDIIPEDAANIRRSAYPVGRESSGKDIANAVFYLGTELSATVTGADLVVDSGIRACLVPYDKS